MLSAIVGGHLRELRFDEVERVPPPHKYSEPPWGRPCPLSAVWRIFGHSEGKARHQLEGGTYYMHGDISGLLR